MSLLTDVNDVISKMSTQARKKYDTTRLDLKIKAYAKEEAELYCRLGKLIYEIDYRHIITNEDILSLYESVDTIKSRKKDLDKQRLHITKTGHTADSQQGQIPQKTHVVLDRKESDLKLTRTKEGIKLIRICPECQTSNSPSDHACVNCSYKFGQGPVNQ